MSHVADSHHGSPSYVRRCQKVTAVSTVTVGPTIPNDKLIIAYVQMELMPSENLSGDFKSYSNSLSLSLNRAQLNLHLLLPRATFLFCVSHQLYKKEPYNILKENDI